MAEIITSGATVIRPTLVLGYESTRAGGNIVHPIIGRRQPDVTLRPGGMRAGRLELLFDDPNPAVAESASAAAETLHNSAAVLTLRSDDRPSIGMSYVVPAGGNITRRLEDATREAWILAVDFEEIGT